VVLLPFSAPSAVSSEHPSTWVCQMTYEYEPRLTGAFYRINDGGRSVRKSVLHYRWDQLFVPGSRSMGREQLCPSCHSCHCNCCFVDDHQLWGHPLDLAHGFVVRTAEVSHRHHCPPFLLRCNDRGMCCHPVLPLDREQAEGRGTREPHSD